MSERICPRCRKVDHRDKGYCTHCGAKFFNEAYVDCYICAGTGQVTLHYTAEYARLSREENSVLPCAKCDGTGRLRRALVDNEIFRAKIKGIVRSIPPLW